jgi:glycine/sarcosine N-methyltransferase
MNMSEISKCETAENFYNRLAEEYHLIFADWRKSVRYHGRIIDGLIRKELGNIAYSVLDCTCGIGTQAIGLALYGHNVSGTDISPAEITRAEKEADSFGVRISFGTADLLSLDSRVNGFFDVIISCDNSLPHLLSINDLRLAIANIRAKLKPGGLFLASTRDYDELLIQRPKATVPQVFDDTMGRRIVFQTWDWLEDGLNYIFHLYILKVVSGNWQTSEYISRYRALKRRELTQILAEAGFLDIRWLAPQQTGFYQPIVICRG